MENMIDTFNVRVYGLLIHQNKLMILKEPYVGDILLKFPGGGLEFGEGVIACLKREFMEELNLEISYCEHFYTQEDFMRSKFKQNEQLLTIYYQVEVKDISRLKLIDEQIIEVKWVDLQELNTQLVNLPIDKLVVEKLTTNK